MNAIQGQAMEERKRNESFEKCNKQSSSGTELKRCAWFEMLRKLLLNEVKLVFGHVWTRKFC